MAVQNVLVVAGEASADLHAAALLKQLQPLMPDAKFFGVGGKALCEQGMEITVPAERLNVVGVADWMDKLSTVLRSYRELKSEIAKRQPTLAILLDLPDFNLRLSKVLKKSGVPIVYYISPQIWAWRRYRVNRIRQNVARMLVVFPFEKEFYDQHGVDSRFVGHPLLDQIKARTEFRTQAEIAEGPRIALLPGSRGSELRNHQELVSRVAELLHSRYPKAQIRIPVASTLSAGQVRAVFPSFVDVVDGDSRETLHWADVAVVASGTATLETAIIGTPFCLFYRLSPSTSWVIRHIIRYKRFFGMPNLLHGREVAREFLHDQAQPQPIFEEVCRMIDDPAYRTKLASDLGRCRTLLGDPGASLRAAQEILRVSRETPNQREGQLVSAPT